MILDRLFMAELRLRAPPADHAHNVVVFQLEAADTTPRSSTHRLFASLTEEMSLPSMPKASEVLDAAEYSTAGPPVGDADGDFAAPDSPVTAVLLVKSRCHDRGREAEFNDWYDRHNVKVFHTTPFEAAYRFKRAALDPAEPSQYLAVWESSGDLSVLRQYVEDLARKRATRTTPDPAPPLVDIYEVTLLIKANPKVRR